MLADNISIIIPAKNEAAVIGTVIADIRDLYPKAEIIVVNDGSTDETADLATEKGARVVSHPYSKGNGAAIKTGAREAQHDVLVFMDADGQHRPSDIQRLLDEMANGFDMVVGARSKESQASSSRLIANTTYNVLASMMVEQPVKDLTSGFRAVRASLFREFLYLLPNGFSYPTTITMAFFRAGYSVAYVPIVADERVGKSHIRILKDGIRFFLIIFKIGTLYSPLKIFTPISLVALSTGIGYYAYTYLTMGRFTNMSAVLFMFAIMVFLIGLISEQITMLMYKDDKR